MAKKYATTIKKLQTAINQQYNKKLLINKTQFYSQEQDRPIEMTIVKQAVWDEEKKKNINIELFKSCNEISVLLFLRDMWYDLNGWEVPDNVNKLKEENT